MGLLLSHCGDLRYGRNMRVDYLGGRVPGINARERVRRCQNEYCSGKGADPDGLPQKLSHYNRGKLCEACHKKNVDKGVRQKDERGGWNKGIALKRYCPQGHDTFLVGRYGSSGGCKLCARQRA